MDEIKQNVHLVKDLLQELNANVPFFIAGGSLFSLMNGDNNYNDIDVFFYNNKHVELVKERVNSIPKTEQFYITEKAITYNPNVLAIEVTECVTECTTNSADIDKSKIVNETLTNAKHTIQLITMVCGDPEDVLNGFDINCSELAVTSEYKFIKSKNYSKNIKVNFDRFSDNTLSRFKKYTRFKGAIDKDDNELMKIFDYLLDNPDMLLRETYSSTTKFKAIQIIEHLPLSDMSISQCDILQNSIIQKLSVNKAISLFSSMLYLVKHVSRASDMLVLSKLLHEKKIGTLDNKSYSYAKMYPDRYNEILDKYPEYFV